ncbi:hypothetical protein CEXT_772771 [Caerostris extrusa]|uniref:Uncharacterized protein n=1 Tax=Caerostris extrusa TaxID=172846 RepID=A0AAV4UET5_CAEEX|nr:hypothetical protein CEXT_772771 [Caerostris extrusa]
MKCRIGSCPARSAVKWGKKSIRQTFAPFRKIQGACKNRLPFGERKSFPVVRLRIRIESGILAENGKSIFLLDLSPVHFLQVDIPFWSETVTKEI